ncbi:glycosyltransferase [Mycobacterium sp.]|uniref:glycosyltransferase n=1 Tax=Mycobacterium sp. TaxID=1785 RepID=UPI0025D62490|nr:glycosyltransferase [Mycobacterium sp.]
MPVVTTLHTPPFPWMEIGAWLAGCSGNFVAVSAAMQQMWSTLADAQVIRNGVDPRRFPPSAGGEALCRVGRFTREKGADIAVGAALAAGRPLRLAGPISDPAWFERVIRPYLGDAVSYLGALSGVELADLYGTSAATLVTPRWEEPFCLVAAESQMCGTPVVGLRRGGLPEVVDDDVGRLVDPGHGAVQRLSAALADVVGFEREAVGAQARATLSLDLMLDGYEQLLMTLGCADTGAGPRSDADAMFSSVAS